MVGHNEIILTIHKRYCYTAKIIQQYIQNNNLYDFANISNKNIDNINEYFKNHNEFNMIIKINIPQFQHILAYENKYRFYLYLYKNLFLLIIELELYIVNLIKINFPKIYNNYKIDLPNIKTKLSFFKTFAINLSLQKNDNLELIRQDATNSHKDSNDCLHAFCIIIVFEDFKDRDLVL